MKRLTTFFLAATLCLCLCAGFTSAAAPAALRDVCSAEEWDMLRQTNARRLDAGLSPYSAFPKLQQAARMRVVEVASDYQLHHTRPDGSECFTVLTEVGLDYLAAGENIAAGQRTVQRVMDGWMGSEGHRANIMDERFTHAGLGYLAEGFLSTSWVQLFLKSSCSVSSIALSPSSAICAPGASLDDLDVAIRATCPIHGDCWLPLDARLCSGFDASKTGLQEVTVSYGGQTAKLQINVTSSAPLDTSGADSWAADWLTRADVLSLLTERSRTGFTSDVTRLQFADLAVRLAENLTGEAIRPAPDDSFTDTADEAIRKARAAGIASGYSADGAYRFRPDNPITRQEICVMLSHVVDYVSAQGIKADGLDRSETPKGPFPDVGHVADWALAHVALMANNSIMGGKADGSGVLLAPLANTTLQEAVTLVVKLYDALH